MLLGQHHQLMCNHVSVYKQSRESNTVKDRTKLHISWHCTCTISLMNFKPPGPISEPAKRYPTITYQEELLETQSIFHKSSISVTMMVELNTKKLRNEQLKSGSKAHTGCPKQEKMIPPMAAETITTTKSEISLHGRNYISTTSDQNIKDMQLCQAWYMYVFEMRDLRSTWSTGYFDFLFDITKVLSCQ